MHVLSPASGFYAILWPIIVRQSSFSLRKGVLQYLNQYIRNLCREVSLRRSDRAKARYLVQKRHFPEQHQATPWLDQSISYGEWRIWSGDKIEFSTFALATFCEMGGIDVNDERVLTTKIGSRHRVWISRIGDIVVRMSGHYLGVLGDANKAIAMYQFVANSGNKGNEECFIYWEELVWNASFI